MNTTLPTTADNQFSGPAPSHDRKGTGPPLAGDRPPWEAWLALETEDDSDVPDCLKAELGELLSHMAHPGPWDRAVFSAQCLFVGIGLGYASMWLIGLR